MFEWVKPTSARQWAGAWNRVGRGANIRLVNEDDDDCATTTGRPYGCGAIGCSGDRINSRTSQVGDVQLTTKLRGMLSKKAGVQTDLPRPTLV